MAKHALPDDVYEWRTGAAECGVSQETFDRWCSLLGDHYIFVDRKLTSHTACDCKSYAQHRDLALIDECGGPLATLLVERQRAEEMAIRALMERCPWLHYHDAKTLAHWKPGDPFIIATEYRPFYAEQRCVCGRRRSEHLFADDLRDGDLSELSRDYNMMCPDRVGLWFTPEDTAAR